MLLYVMLLMMKLVHTDNEHVVYLDVYNCHIAIQDVLSTNAKQMLVYVLLSNKRDNSF